MGIARLSGECVHRIQQRLREARELAGLSQNDVAIRLGVPQSAVSLVERGQQELTLWWLIALCEVYGEAAWLLVQQETIRMHTVLGGPEPDKAEKVSGRKKKVVNGEVVG